MYLARSYYPLRIEECKMGTVLIFKEREREREQERARKERWYIKRDGITKSGGHGDMMKDERWDENDMNEKMRMMMSVCVCVFWYILFVLIAERCYCHHCYQRTG